MNGQILATCFIMYFEHSSDVKNGVAVICVIAHIGRSEHNHLHTNTWSVMVTTALKQGYPVVWILDFRIECSRRDLKSRSKKRRRPCNERKWGGLQGKRWLKPKQGAKQNALNQGLKLPSLHLVRAEPRNWWEHIVIARLLRSKFIK